MARKPSLLSSEEFRVRGPSGFPRKFSRNLTQPSLLKCSVVFLEWLSVKEGKAVYGQRTWEGRREGRGHAPAFLVNLQECVWFSFWIPKVIKLKLAAMTCQCHVWFLLRIFKIISSKISPYAIFCLVSKSILYFLLSLLVLCILQAYFWD